MFFDLTDATVAYVDALVHAQARELGGHATRRQGGALLLVQGIAEKLVEPGDSDLLVSFNNLALTYEAMGEYAKADAIYKLLAAMEREVKRAQPMVDKIVPLYGLGALGHLLSFEAIAKIAHRITHGPDVGIVVNHPTGSIVKCFSRDFASFF